MSFTPHSASLRATSADGSVNEAYDYTFYVNSTLAHQLAQYVVFYSPIQMVADLPENYREHAAALEFIRDVPVDWATTKCLDGEIGDYVVTARKDKYSDDWYVGGITDGERREVEVSLNFLDADRTYRATIYRDGSKAGWDTNPTDYVIEVKEVTNADVLNLVMSPGGGFAISLQAK